MTFGLVTASSMSVMFSVIDVHIFSRPRKGPPRFLTEGRISMTKSGHQVCFFVFNCLGLLSFIELCIFLCRLVLFVSTLAK